jgi:hypothetical protein
MSEPFFLTSDVAAQIDSWLARRLPPEVAAWLEDRQIAVASGDKRALYLAFGMVVRKTGKADLDLDSDEMIDAALVRPGWVPRGWTVDQAARMSLVLKYPSQKAAEYVQTLDQLFATGEVHELVALYQGLPLYPHQAAFQLRCAEGIRSNIRAVFCAVAHRNPYPSEQLNDDQWNQLILKCQFVGVPLHLVVGLDDRANPRLAQMLADYAHERWAAGRPVSPELWRCVGPFADDALLADLEKVLKTGSETEQWGAALALQSCPHPRAKELLAAVPDLVDDSTDLARSWTALASSLD